MSGTGLYDDICLPANGQAETPRKSTNNSACGFIQQKHACNCFVELHGKP